MQVQWASAHIEASLRNTADEELSDLLFAMYRSVLRVRSSAAGILAFLRVYAARSSKPRYVGSQQQ